MPVTRVAMWSGPRTLSTALMRSWENRSETVVVDEPLYAFYLAHTGIDHPGRTDVLASQASDWPEVVTMLTGGRLPPGTKIYYQKHMWGRYWYGSVRRSTGFGPYHPPSGPLPSHLAALAGQCRPFYERLRAGRLAPVTGRPSAADLR